MESGLTFRFGGKAARAPMVIDCRNHSVFSQQKAELRRQRLILTVAGSVAFSGLATLAYHYTAPFADPPSFAVAAQTIAVAAPQAAAPAVEERADVATEIAAKPVEQAALPAEPETAPPQEVVASPVESAVAEEIEVLDPNDPRWSSPIAVVNPAPAVAPEENRELAYAAGNPAADALRRTIVDDRTDDTETSAIPAPRPAVKAIEPEPPAVVDGREPTRTATIARAVNMRARGTKGARVLGVIPQGATVGLVDCGGWCEVIYEGRRGFIYKSFIDGSGRTADATEAARPRKPSKPRIVPPQQNDINALGR